MEKLPSIVPPWVGWLSISIWLCIYLPISLWGIFLFYKYRFVQVISKRHVTITLIVLLFCLSHICIDRVLWTMYHICNISTNANLLNILNIISILTYPIILYGLIYTLLWRFWIIRYDGQCKLGLVNNKWRSVINGEYIEENWYLTHKLSLGNSKFIFSYIILPIYLFCIIVSIIIRFTIYGYSDYIHLWIIDMTIVIIPYCKIIFLHFNTPHFHDTFWIYEATKVIFIVLFILFSTNIIFGIINIIFMQYNIIFSLVESHIICIVNLFIILIMTFGVFYKNKASFAPQQQLQAFLSTHNHKNKPQIPSNAPKLVLTPTDSHQKSHTLSPKYKRISLSELIENSIMFHTFMAHLATEFSMECLLAIVEFTEYTDYCIHNFKDYLSTKHDYKSRLVKLPHDIPQSLIVYGSKHTHKNIESKLHQRIITPMLQNLNLKLRSNSNSNTNTNGTHKASPPNGTGNNLHPLSSTPESKPIDNNTATIITIPPLQLANTNSSKYSNNGNVAIINRNSSDSYHRKHKHKGLYGNLKPFQTKAKLLYEKYIEVGAQYEINISYSLRNAFNTMLNNDELWSSVFDTSHKNRNKLQNEKIISEKLHEILSLLNKSIQEMIKLLSHSYARFKQTQTYEKLLRLHKP